MSKKPVFFTENNFDEEPIHIKTTPLTQKKFLNVCLLMLKKEIHQTKKPVLVQEMLKNLLEKVEAFNKNHSEKTASFMEWQVLEENILKSAEEINKGNKECAERLKLAMIPGLTRMKEQVVPGKSSPDISL
ncbi:MAG TPA: hypothetical protein VLI69_00335 [Gammaproteobacteria bacterium]|nr:hypothetical protein [Gammaproteobacteria bacterium]